MRKLILLMLLLCAVIASGCSENVPPKEDAKNAATAAVQEKKDISFKTDILLKRLSTINYAS